MKPSTPTFLVKENTSLITGSPLVYIMNGIWKRKSHPSFYSTFKQNPKHPPMHVTKSITGMGKLEEKHQGQKKASANGSRKITVNSGSKSAYLLKPGTKALGKHIMKLCLTQCCTQQLHQPERPAASNASQEHQRATNNHGCCQSAPKHPQDVNI